MVDGLGTDKLIGQGIASVVVVLGMFVANRYWTFADALERELPSAEWAPAGPAASRGEEQSERVQRATLS
jgi:hypothetical protein